MPDYSPTTWTNETPAASPVKYKITDDSSGVLANSAKIEVVTSVTAGTPLNATNFNKIEQGIVSVETKANTAITNAATAQSAANAAQVSASAANTKAITATATATEALSAVNALYIQRFVPIFLPSLTNYNGASVSVGSYLTYLSEWDLMGSSLPTNVIAILLIVSVKWSSNNIGNYLSINSSGNDYGVVRPLNTSFYTDAQVIVPVDAGHITVNVGGAAAPTNVYIKIAGYWA